MSAETLTLLIHGWDNETEESLYLMQLVKANIFSLYTDFGISLYCTQRRYYYSNKDKKVHYSTMTQGQSNFLLYDVYWLVDGYLIYVGTLTRSMANSYQREGAQQDYDHDFYQNTLPAKAKKIATEGPKVLANYLKNWKVDIN